MRLYEKKKGEIIMKEYIKMGFGFSIGALLGGALIKSFAEWGTKKIDEAESKKDHEDSTEETEGEA